MGSLEGTSRSSVLCVLWATILLLACVPRPADASTITIGIGLWGCGQETASTPSTSLAFSREAAWGPSGSGCNPGSDLRAQVEATLTSVKISASAPNPFVVSSGPSYAGAEVTLLDTVTVSGGTGNGTLVMSIGVTGELGASGIFLSQFSVIAPLVPAPNWNEVGSWLACGADLTRPSVGIDECPGTWGQVTTVNDVISLSIPFVFGVPLNTQLRSAGGTRANAWWSEGGAGTVDFFNTAQILPLVVLDSSGNQVAGATAMSDSGFSYTMADAPVSVPEPASLLLFATGLVGLSGRRRLR